MGVPFHCPVPLYVMRSPARMLSPTQQGAELEFRVSASDAAGGAPRTRYQRERTNVYAALPMRM
jgi:hypothetical protein